MKKKKLLLAMAAVIVLFCGCGDDGGRSRDRQDVDVSAENPESTEAPTPEPTAEPPEEPKSMYNFNVERDVLFTYEYDESGKVSNVYYNGYDAKYSIEDATYDGDGNLCSWKATYKKTGLDPRITTVEYNADGQIVSMTETWSSATSKQLRRTEVTYKKDGTIETFSWYDDASGEPGETTGYNANLNKIYRESYMKYDDGYRRYYHEYDDGVEVHSWSYYADGSLWKEYIYYDNGQQKEYYLYDKKGNVEAHWQYDRNGTKIN